jgi:hypothetical protein
MIVSKDSRAQSRLEKAAREGADVGAHYEVQAKATREKMARLRALRLAKQAAEQAAAEQAPKVIEKSLKAGRKPAGSRAPLR